MKRITITIEDVTESDQPVAVDSVAATMSDEVYALIRAAHEWHSDRIGDPRVRFVPREPSPGEATEPPPGEVRELRTADRNVSYVWRKFSEQIVADYSAAETLAAAKRQLEAQFREEVAAKQAAVVYEGVES